MRIFLLIFLQIIFKIGLKENKSISSQLSSRLKGDYREFTIYIEENDNEALNGKEVRIHDDYYLGFGDVTSSGLVLKME